MDRPLFQRKFTLNGEPVDLEDFVSEIALNPRDAASIFLEIDQLQPGVHMFFWLRHHTDADLYRLE